MRHVQLARPRERVLSCDTPPQRLRVGERVAPQR